VGSLLCLSAAALGLLAQGLPSAQATVDFSKRLQVWDGFGVHYVEVRHTRDYRVFPQDYGGFKYLSPAEREQVSRAGQPGMAVAEASSNDPEIQLIAFASNGTKHPNAFAVINLARSRKPVSTRVSGARPQRFVA
jgi:hypothetical protein